VWGVVTSKYVTNLTQSFENIRNYENACKAELAFEVLSCEKYQSMSKTFYCFIFLIYVNYAIKHIKASKAAWEHF